MAHRWVSQTEANHQEQEVKSKYQATICFPMKGANGNFTTTAGKGGWDSEAIINLQNECALGTNNLKKRERINSSILWIGAIKVFNFEINNKMKYTKRKSLIK